MGKKIKIKNWMTSQEGILDHLRSANPFTVRIEIVDHLVLFGYTDTVTSKDYGTDGIDVSFRMPIGNMVAHDVLQYIDLNDPDLKVNITVVESNGKQLFYNTFPISVLSVRGMAEDNNLRIVLTLSITQIVFAILRGKYMEQLQKFVSKRYLTIPLNDSDVIENIKEKKYEQEN